MNRLRHKQSSIRSTINRQHCFKGRQFCRPKIQTMTAALDCAIVALEDWVNISAHEWCDESRVYEARRRVYEHGFLWYIATTVAKCKDAINMKGT